MPAVATGPNLQLAQDLDTVTELVARGPCVRAAARTGAGSACASSHPESHYFCPMGAAMVVTKVGDNAPDHHMRYMDVMDALHHELGFGVSIAVYSDTRPHAEVVALCRRAAARARGLA